MYPYLANYLKIEGDDVVCDSSIYYVSGIPSNCRVEWLYNYNSAPFPTITHDYPSVNMCMIRNPNKFPYSLNLSAVIYCDTIPVDTISRKIVSAQSTFSASYSQEACTYYGVSHPSINSSNVVLGTPIFVHQGCLVTVLSYGFMGRTITHSGVTPQNFYFNGVNQITFSLPIGSGGIPFHIHVGGTGVCQEYDILFFSASGNGNILNNSVLEIMKIGDKKYKFSISLPKEEQTPPEKITKKEVWEISIYEAKTGRLVCTKKCFDMPYILDTSEIKEGLYVVRMCAGNDVLTEKFTITK